jgi:predicted ABC-type ATPase
MNIMTFTMGLPASGKSSVIADGRAKVDGFTLLDCDSFKEAHPDYDPKNPQALHSWSKQMVKQAFNEALETGGQFVYDTTGTNAPRMVEEMNRAKKAGFTVRLVFVKVDLVTSIGRNQDPSRNRIVPLPVIMEKAEKVNRVFDEISNVPHEVLIIDNSRDNTLNVPSQYMEAFTV